MKKIVIYYLTVIMCVCVFSACQMRERAPLTVTFYDVSSAMSSDHTIKIQFAEEKDYEDYFVDILVKSDVKDIELTIFQEFSDKNDKTTIKIDAANKYISLDEYKIFNLESEQTDSMVGYSDVLQTTIVINSSKDATLTLLAIVGEKDGENFNQIAKVSNEYVLKVKSINSFGKWWLSCVDKLMPFTSLQIWENDKLNKIPVVIRLF